MAKIKIGFIGQGFIGKNYADDFEERGHDVVRYALEPDYVQNRDAISNCEFVFIAVPTPTTPEGFNTKTLEDVLTLVGPGNVAVIKSTVLPGTTDRLQDLFPNITVLHSPEFLTEATAAHDARHPDRNIVGYVAGLKTSKRAAWDVLSLLPGSPYDKVVPVRAAEMIKYGGNCWFYLKVVYINMLYDLSQKLGIDYEIVKDGMSADPRIGSTHLDPIHKSGRGAGGHCFIKDMEAFMIMYEENFPNDTNAIMGLGSLISKNNELLRDSNKDLDILKGVYGDIK